MANNTNKTKRDDLDQINVPMTLTIRDVVFIVVAVVSMVTAWGLFGTRLSIVEEKIIYISENMSEIKTIVKELKIDDKNTGNRLHSELDKLDIRLRNVENSQAQLKVLLKNKNNKN